MSGVEMKVVVDVLDYEEVSSMCDKLYFISSIHDSAEYMNLMRLSILFRF